MKKSDHTLDIEIRHPYLAIKDELWGVCYEY